MVTLKISYFAPHPKANESQKEQLSSFVCLKVQHPKNVSSLLISALKPVSLPLLFYITSVCCQLAPVHYTPKQPIKSLLGRKEVPVLNGPSAVAHTSWRESETL